MSAADSRSAASPPGVLPTYTARAESARVDVVIVAPNLLEAFGNRGGIERIDQRIAAFLSRRRDVGLVGPFRTAYKGRTAISRGCSVWEVPFPAREQHVTGSRWYTFWVSLIGIPLYCLALSVTLLGMMHHKPKVTVVHNGLPGFSASVIARFCGCGVLFSEGNTIPWVSPYVADPPRTLTRRVSRIMYLCTGKLIAGLSHAIRAQSHAIANGMIEMGVPAGNIKVIPAGVDIDVVRHENWSRRGDGFRVGFVGRLADEKGAPLLVKVVREASQVLPEVMFTIVGDGPYASFLRGIPSVRMLGWVPHENLNAAISDLDVVLSFQKELGLAELEAMAAGKPLIAYAGAGTRQYVEDRVNSILCDGEPESYIDALRMLIEQPAMLRAISEGARQMVIDHFGWEHLTEDWISLIGACEVA